MHFSVFALLAQVSGKKTTSNPLANTKLASVSKFRTFIYFSLFRVKIDFIYALTFENHSSYFSFLFKHVYYYCLSTPVPCFALLDARSIFMYIPWLKSLALCSTVCIYCMLLLVCVADGCR